MKYLIYLFLPVMIFWSCSSGSSDTTGENNPFEEEAAEESADSGESSADVPEQIEWNPRYTWEEFAVASSSDVMPDEDLQSHYAWFQGDEESPVIVMEGTDNSIVVLDPTEDTNFDVTILDKAEIYDFNPNTVSIEFYDFFVMDFDEDEEQELLILIEVVGMAPAEDGMRPVQFITSVAIEYQDGEIILNEEMADEYNQEIGATTTDVELATLELLGQKYNHMAYLDESQSDLFGDIIDDMDIHSENADDENGFRRFSEEDGERVRYASSVGQYHFVSSPDNGWPDLEDISESDYPVVVSLYQMLDVYSIQSIEIEESNMMVSAKLIKTEQDGLVDSGESKNFKFSYSDSEWILSEDQYKDGTFQNYNTIANSQDYPVIQDE